MLRYMIEHLFVAHFVHDLMSFDGRFLCDADELLSESAGSVGSVEVEQTLGRIYSEEGGYVLVVGQRRRQANKTDGITDLLRSTDRTSDYTLQNRTAFIVEKVDFVDDDESDEVGVTHIRALASDDIPFFRGSDDDLCFRNLLFRHLRVSGQLSDLNAIG